MTYDDFASLALALPDVEEKASRRDLDLMRAGRHMARLREQGAAVAIRLPWDRCDQLIQDDPETFFVTPHYRGYPYVLAWLESLEPELAKRIVRDSWEAAPLKIATRKG